LHYCFQEEFWRIDVGLHQDQQPEGQSGGSKGAGQGEGSQEKVKIVAK
jgi:hypothetical protein